MAEPRSPSYLKAMLTSQANLYAALAAGVAATVTSLFFGFGAGAIPLVLFAAGEAIAALYIPSLSTFRAMVDRKERALARDALRNHLIDEITRRGGQKLRGSQELAGYNRMRERVRSLYEVGADARTQLSVRDVEKLDDATVDFLSLWLARMIIDDRSRALPIQEVERTLAEIEARIKASQQRPGHEVDLRQQQLARQNYLGLLASHRRMSNRRLAIEASILSMPDQMEEIYQSVITAPGASDVGSKMTEAIDRLRVAEEIEVELANDLGESLPEYSGAIAARAAPGVRQKTTTSSQEAA